MCASPCMRATQVSLHVRVAPHSRAHQGRAREHLGEREWRISILKSESEGGDQDEPSQDSPGGSVPSGQGDQYSAIGAEGTLPDASSLRTPPTAPTLPPTIPSSLTAKAASKTVRFISHTARRTLHRLYAPLQDAIDSAVAAPPQATAGRLPESSRGPSSSPHVDRLELRQGRQAP